MDIQTCKYEVTVETYEGLYKYLEKLFSKNTTSIQVDDLENGGYRITWEETVTRNEITPKKPEIITPDYYQKLSRRTQNEQLTDYAKRLHALHGLCSEVGEIHSIFQHEYQGKELSKEKVIDECGDLCWFLCELLDTFAVDFSQVLRYNVDKLRKRYPEGFDAVRSEKRHEGEK